MSGRWDDAASVYVLSAEDAVKQAAASALLAAFATAELPGKEGGTLKARR